MRNVKVERTVAASRSDVWAVLADYPNIVDWNDGIINSYAIGEATEGVGAQRQCELVPNGKMSMRETVAEWVPEEKMAIAIDEIEEMSGPSPSTPWMSGTTSGCTGTSTHGPPNASRL